MERITGLQIPNNDKVLLLLCLTAIVAPIKQPCSGNRWIIDRNIVPMFHCFIDLIRILSRNSYLHAVNKLN